MLTQVLERLFVSTLQCRALALPGGSAEQGGNVGGLEGKVAIVTGAGSGIGRASATRLADAGAKVVVADINLAGGEETVEQIRKAGGEATAVLADVSDEASVGGMVAAAVDTYGSLQRRGPGRGEDAGADGERIGRGGRAVRAKPPHAEHGRAAQHRRGRRLPAQRRGRLHHRPGRQRRRRADVPHAAVLELRQLTGR